MPHSMHGYQTQKTRDTKQFAKFITDLATGEIALSKIDDGKDPAAVALGRKARAESMTAKPRPEIAKRAAAIRWKGLKG